MPLVRYLSISPHSLQRLNSTAVLMAGFLVRTGCGVVSWSGLAVGLGDRLCFFPPTCSRGGQSGLLIRSELPNH